MLDHLRDTDIRNNIYYDTSKELVSNIDDKLDAHGMIKHEAGRRKLYGIYTGTKSREQMFSLLDGHIKDHKDKFVGKYIISDIMSLVRTKTGKIVAGTGYHDDNIMSYNMCLYLYYYGNNLQRFGFVRGRLPDEKDRNQGMSYADAFSSLSETDRKYFEGAYNPPTIDMSDIDMESIIQSNRGLVSFQELSQTEKKDHINKPIIYDDYTRKLMIEMESAQRESDVINRRVRFKDSYENTDYDEFYEDGMDMNLFSELNDI